jgi:hypothetical protein
MKGALKIVFASIVLAVALLGSGCVVREGYAPPPPYPGPVTGYDYYYYPDYEVYYYPVTGVYWWSDGGVWVSGRRCPSRFILRDDMRVRVRLNTDRPWTEHREVIRQYPHREAPRVVPRQEPRVAPRVEPRAVPHQEPRVVPHQEPRVAPREEPRAVPHEEPGAAPREERQDRQP